MFPALLLSLTLAGTPGLVDDGGLHEAQKDDNGKQGSKEKGFDLIILPLPNFNTDLGFGLGLVGGVYIYDKGYKPYRYAISGQVFFTTSGVQTHYFRFDAPDIFPRTRLELRLEYSHQLFSPYYGPGNVTEPGQSSVPGQTKGRFFSYDRRTYGGWFRLRFKPFDEGAPLHKLQPYVGFGARQVGVSPYQDTLLLQQSPTGVDGGVDSRIILGLIWDSRDDQNDPSRGGIEEVGLQLFLPALGSAFGYGQVTLSERRVFTVAPSLVYAFRVVVDQLWGDVPFWALSSSGSTQPFGGIGGVSSVRGVTLNRYTGMTKALINNELRWLPLEIPILGVTTKFGASTFIDTGRVWEPGVPDGTFWNWHVGAGAGLRLVRREAVLRADYAFWLGTDHRALYLTFGYPY